jgi:hypothetical protein
MVPEGFQLSSKLCCLTAWTPWHLGQHDPPPEIRPFRHLAGKYHMDVPKDARQKISKMKLVINSLKLYLPPQTVITKANYASTFDTAFKGLTASLYPGKRKHRLSDLTYTTLYNRIKLKFKNAVEAVDVDQVE